PLAGAGGRARAPRTTPGPRTPRGPVHVGRDDARRARGAPLAPLAAGAPACVAPAGGAPGAALGATAGDRGAHGVARPGRDRAPRRGNLRGGGELARGQRRGGGG